MWFNWQLRTIFPVNLTFIRLTHTILSCIGQIISQQNASMLNFQIVSFPFVTNGSNLPKGVSEQTSFLRILLHAHA